MKALVLAAGEGERLRPLTLDRPKPMVSIGGRPLLEHTLALLKKHGVTDVAINLHYKPEVVTEYFNGSSEMNLVYSYENPILGTAGAAKRLSQFFDSTFFVLYGDVLTDLDLSAVLTFHRSRDSVMTMVLYEVEEPTRCGIVELDQDNRLLDFVEKPTSPRSNLANSGVYLLEPKVLEYIPDGFADFGFDVLPRLIAAGLPIFGLPINPNSYLLDIGSIERYEQANVDVQNARIRPLRLILERS